jgi:hypothetical protein
MEMKRNDYYQDTVFHQKKNPSGFCEDKKGVQEIIETTTGSTAHYLWDRL